MSIDHIQNNESGASVRSKLNHVIDRVNDASILANTQDRERFFRTVLQPHGIDQPPDVLFWPSPYREGGYEADVARPGTGWTFNNRGVLTPNGTDVLRRGFDPATGAFLGALAEPQRENRLTWSEDFGNSDWQKTEITAAQVDGPVWSLTADAGTGIVPRMRFSAGVPINSPRGYRFQLQKGTQTRIGFVISSDTFSDSSGAQRFVFNFDTGAFEETFGTQAADAFKVRPLVGGWFEFTAIRAGSVSGTFSGRPHLFFVGETYDLSAASYAADYDGDESVLIRYPQLEAVESFVSSYIKTEAAAVIRPADTLTLPQVGDRRRGFAVWQGVMSFDEPESSVSRYPFSRQGGVQHGLRAGNTTLAATQPNSSTTMASLTGLADLRGRRVRIAYQWDADSGSGRVSIDGVSASGTAQQALDIPFAFGQSEQGTQGRSWTEWFYVSYNYPTVEQIEALTGEVAP